MAKKMIFFVLLFTAQTVFCQDSVYVRRMVNTLAAKTFWGRGYTKNGMTLAANFLAAEYKKIGLAPMRGEFKQPFYFPVNTFPGKMEVAINGKKLTAGKDYIINNESPSIKFEGKLIGKDSSSFEASPKLRVVLKDKLTWSVATEVSTETIIQILKKNFKERPKTIAVNIENKFIDHFAAANICGLVKGTLQPDSLIMITAHYDHLGGMGADTYFPGANDNAAGVATLLSLAKYYQAHPQRYSIGFICFAGEEAGLIGSNFYTENPLLPLDKIKFLVNLDLVGTGEMGMTVVNATVYPKAFAVLNQLNDNNHYLVKINKRGKAANSDHYFFTEKGVPAFFMYTQGGPQAYHDVFDVPEKLPLNEYKDLFNLLLGFFDEMIKLPADAIKN